MIRPFTLALMAGSLCLALAACGEEEKSETPKPAKQVEKAEPQKETVEKNNRDMTPAEALDNMKRDAGIVADKATDAFNAAKEAAEKALSE
ncbi:hypothetical protein RYZ26_00600 [Terasakiella sp. A23]|uniref:hypothetical protein n=1 Tax=Terasakiella sp. FCG-A23 TaxID=3080561 RepID=UPI002953CECB|nr:hypothetical protein [Terasakiella sp. A23]MDV7338073.1 hypothetical protein [Terasakiella sp. A23]